MWVSCYSMCMFDEIWHKWICCMGCNVMWHALCSMIIKYCYRMLPWSLWRTFWYACCPVQDTNPFSEQKLQIESFRQYIECFNRKWESNVDPHSPCVTPIRCREGVTWLVNLSIVFTHCIGQTKTYYLSRLCGSWRCWVWSCMLSLTITIWRQWLVLDTLHSTLLQGSLHLGSPQQGTKQTVK